MFTYDVFLFFAFYGGFTLETLRLFLWEGDFLNFTLDACVTYLCMC